MTTKNSDRFFVVTGGPGAGKTTLIDALARIGYARSVEAARAIIQDQVAIGGRALPWCDPAMFAEMMLAWEMRSYRLACEEAGPVFFDRAIPELAGYLGLVGLPVPAHIEKAVETFRYNRRVFLAPLWPEIYTQDSERKQTLADAERGYRAAVETYTAYGYELVAIPRATVEERVRFVLREAGLCVDA
ncbi:MAG: AAA family ATPase [Candidatus Binataceae bacterium]